MELPMSFIWTPTGTQWTSSNGPGAKITVWEHQHLFGSSWPFFFFKKKNSKRFWSFPFGTRDTDTLSWGGSKTLKENKKEENKKEQEKEMLYNVQPNTEKQTAFSSLTQHTQLRIGRMSWRISFTRDKVLSLPKSKVRDDEHTASQARAQEKNQKGLQEWMISIVRTYNPQNEEQKHSFWSCNYKLHCIPYRKMHCLMPINSHSFHPYHSV